MNSKLRSKLVLLFCSLLILQTSLMAQKSSETTKDASKGTEIAFPDVEGWEKGATDTYPSPELGYSVPYQSPGNGTVTIYVYNGGNKVISSDLDSVILTNEIDRARSDIRQFGELGYYEGVKEITNDTVVLGGTSGKVNCLHSLFNFKVRGTEVTSEIYLFGYKNNFIKIRSTRPLDKPGEKNEAIVKLFSAIDTVFSK